jgi:hypothetical protein
MLAASLNKQPIYIYILRQTIIAEADLDKYF